MLDITAVAWLLIQTETLNEDIVAALEPTTK